MYSKKIEILTTKILTDFGIKELPIPVDKVAEKLEVNVTEYDLGDDVSGILVVNNGKGTIGLNPNTGMLRQRFTIAHELGHYVLHRQKGDLFIDKKYKVYYRDGVSSTGSKLEEIEANSFAAALLMPREKLIEEIKLMDIDLTEENPRAIIDLANKFGVSQTAMTYRITNLGLL